MTLYRKAIEASIKSYTENAPITGEDEYIFRLEKALIKAWDEIEALKNKRKKKPSMEVQMQTIDKLFDELTDKLEDKIGPTAVIYLLKEWGYVKEKIKK